MEKMMKTAKSLDKILKVLQNTIKYAMIAVVCVLLVLSVIAIVDPNAIIAKGNYSLDLGRITVKLMDSYSPKDNSSVLIYSWLFCGFGAIIGVATYYALNQIRKLLKPMAEGNPFHHSVSDSFKKVAYASVVLGLVSNLVSFLVTFNISRMLTSLNVYEYVLNGTFKSITINYTFDLSFLIIFFILLLMSYIFQYGEELQQQVDETL